MRTILLICLLSVSIGMFAQPWTQDDTIFNPSGIPSLTFSQPRFVDWEGDTDHDFLLGGTGSVPLYIRNDGTFTNPVFSVQSNGIDVISSLDAEVAAGVDLNDDGVCDLVTGGFTGLHFFENTGTNASPGFSNVAGTFDALNVGSSPVPDLGDIDHDGDLDLVVGLSEDGGVRLYYNIGTATNPQFSESSMTVLGDVGLYAYPVFCDPDGDGDLDVLAGRDAHGFVCFRNISTGGAITFDDGSSMFAGLGADSYWNAPTLADLNGDNLPDLLFGTADGPLQYYRNTGTTASPVWTADTTLFGGVLDTGGASSPVLYDFDGDGDLDMICGSNLGDVLYYENTGTTEHPAWNEDSEYFSSIDHSIYSAAAVGDVDDDGRPDLIVGDLSGNLYYHRNTGTGFVEQPEVLSDVSFGGFSVPRLVDMDSDGDLDLVVGCEDGSVHYLRNTSMMTLAWTEVANYFIGIDVGSNSVPAIADLDGDGDYDLLVGDLFGDIHAYINSGMNWTVNTMYAAGITVDQNLAPAPGDLDGDGDPDLVIGDYNGNLHYYRNGLYTAETLNPPGNVVMEMYDSADLHWEAPIAGSTAPFVQYNVYLDGALIGSTTDQSWTFPGLLGDVTHQAAVTAAYSAGESAPVVLNFLMVYHPTPAGLAGMVENEQLLITWIPAGNLAYYSVTVDSSAAIQVTEPHYTITNPVPGQEYTVTVRNVFLDGIVSLPASITVIYTDAEDCVQTPVAARNQPNPFNPSTTIVYSLPRAARIELSVFNLRGQLVTRLVDCRQSAGRHEATWNGVDEQGRTVGSGVYFYRLDLDGQSVLLNRMILMK